MTAKHHLARAAVSFYGLQSRDPGKASRDDTRKELSSAAALLDSEDPIQAEALSAVIAADDAIRAIERSTDRAETEIAMAMAAVRHAEVESKK